MRADTESLVFWAAALTCFTLGPVSRARADGPASDALGFVAVVDAGVALSSEGGAAPNQAPTLSVPRAARAPLDASTAVDTGPVLGIQGDASLDAGYFVCPCGTGADPDPCSMPIDDESADGCSLHSGGGRSTRAGAILALLAVALHRRRAAGRARERAAVR